ncbi:MAG: primase [Candidatus Eremiobacteraeota bacterium]|nr:primase [Candidatus Eremiobacteraeota bacterium]
MRRAGTEADGGASNVCAVRIDDGVKREVLARADIGEVIGAYVTLRKRGNDLVGLCPFHGEKSPSFHVHPDRGFYKCFGCDAKGDVLTFVQKHENVGFQDALRILGKRYGVEIENEDPRTARVRSEKEAIYHANDVARAWFHRMLLDPREGAAARAYCANRGITDATIEAFSLGFAPDRWDGRGSLGEELRRNDVDLALAAKAGLLKPSQRGGFYDFYRDRLMIPTLATTGETIAFGGRALGDQEPKYINTTTTPVYTKGRYLFALNVARRAAAREDTAIVVEGYLDCIALHQAGFANAVAALGTAFTPEQARELRKVASRAILCFDADTAGIDAALKSIDVLTAEGVVAAALRIPDGKDPDEFVRRNGADAFRALLDKPIPATQVKIDAEIDRRGNRTESGAMARWAEETIRRIAPPEEQDRWRVYAAGRLGLSVDDLRKARLLFNPVHFAPRGGEANASRHIVPAAMELPSVEREVLCIVLDEPPLIAEYAERIPPQRFENVRLRRIWETLREHARSLVQPSDVRAVFAGDDDAAATLASVSGVVRLNDTEERRAQLDRVVVRFARDDAQRRYRELEERIDRLFEAGDPVPTDLRAEHAALAAELKG